MAWPPRSTKFITEVVNHMHMANMHIVKITCTLYLQVHVQHCCTVVLASIYRGSYPDTGLVLASTKFSTGSENVTSMYYKNNDVGMPTKFSIGILRN